MKNGLIYLAAAALMLGWACSRIEENSIQEKPVGAKMTFTATLGDLSDGDLLVGEVSDTKTALQPPDENDKRAIWWTPGDAINIFYGSMSSSKFETDITEAQPIAPFFGTLGAATGASDVGINTQTFWGVYPYNEDNTCDGEGVTLTIPGKQPGIPGGFADKLNPTVANSPGLGLSFYNVGSWFIFTVSGEGITSLTLQGNKDEYIAGKIRVTMDENGKPVSEVVEGLKSITITPEGGGAFEVGEEYRIVLIPKILRYGITLTMRKGSQIATNTISSSLIFKRSSYLRKRNADSNVIWVDTFVELAEGFKWGKMNVGAVAPEDYGDYFAWGESEPKDTYTEDNYNPAVTYFADAAMENWGSDWRIPSATQWNWLLENCSWTWTTLNDVAGYQVTSNVPGYTDNSIFLPAAGNMTDYLQYGGEGGFYWTSQSIASASDKAAFLLFRSNNKKVSDDEGTERYKGLSVRPVSGSPVVHVTGVSFASTTYAVLGGSTLALMPSVEPADATNQSLSWTSSDPSVAHVNPAGLITGLSIGTVTITVQTEDGGYTATCTVTVIPDDLYVNMGDGIGWGRCNIGASRPGEYGYYYAWGETQTKSSYTRDNYDSDLTFEDVATAAWGGSWRMPTYSEWEWLRDNCTWTWAVMNGNNGFIVQSNISGFESSMIFLPAAGRKNGTSLDRPGEYGHYWSSDVGSNGTKKNFHFRKQLVQGSTGPLGYYGMSVRPVYGPKQHINGHEYVEMGDGLKWATMNIGADTPEGYGDYYAWGETEPYYSSLSPLTWKTGKESGYVWASYFDNPSGDGHTFIKYGSDKKTQLDLEDDAARVNWGGTWRIPTKADWNFLMNTDNCDWTWDDVRKGYVVTSKVSGYEGNSIFLPSAGVWIQTTLYVTGTHGCYWSSTIYEEPCARAVIPEEEIVRWNEIQFYNGLSVRAVSE